MKMVGQRWAIKRTYRAARNESGNQQARNERIRNSSEYQNRYMGFSDKQKIIKMKSEYNMYKLTMLLFTLSCGFLALAYIIYAIFGDVNSYFLEDTAPGGVTTILVTILCFYLFKSKNTRMFDRHRELYGFCLDDIEEVSTGRENKKELDEIDNSLANQDREEC